jgi:hypothetical protein
LDATLCRWVSGSRRFERTCPFIFKFSHVIIPAPQRHIQDGRNPTLWPHYFLCRKASLRVVSEPATLQGQELTPRATVAPAFLTTRTNINTITALSASVQHKSGRRPHPYCIGASQGLHAAPDRRMTSHRAHEGEGQGGVRNGASIMVGKSTDGGQQPGRVGTAL